MTGAGGGPPFRLVLAPEAEATWEGLRRLDSVKWKRVNKALRLLKADPRHPGLNCHKWDILKGKGPRGEDIWTAYVENNTPGAWRLFFVYSAQDPGLIEVTSIRRHS